MTIIIIIIIIITIIILMMMMMIINLKLILMWLFNSMEFVKVVKEHTFQ